jgi:GrpB-like predicted nucleotidyltransferase (UPF0157 family)
MIEVKDYNPLWKDDFKAVARIISEKLGPLAIKIEHTGSTSVPGLCAKPILDIIVVIESRDKLKTVYGKLAEVGFIHQGDLGVKGREAFKREPGDPLKDDNGYVFTHQHLYVCAEGSVELKKHVAFRNYLRKHPDKTREYCELKKRLAGECGDDRDKYTDMKTPFVTAALEKAIEED